MNIVFMGFLNFAIITGRKNFGGEMYGFER